AWGAYQALLLIVYRATRHESAGPAPPRGTGRWGGGGIVFFLFVCLCWLFFCAQSLGPAWQMVYAVLFNLHLQWQPSALLLLEILLPLFIVEWIQLVGRDIAAPLRLPPAYRAALYVTCFYLLVIYGVYASKEFIYFQF